MCFGVYVVASNFIKNGQVNFTLALAMMYEEVKPTSG